MQNAEEKYLSELTEEELEEERKRSYWNTSQ